METPSFAPAFLEDRNLPARAFNDNCGRAAEVLPPSRVLVALQDPLARRRMTQVLRAQGFRAISLDEPFAAWSMVVEQASPRLSGFDFVICGGFRSGDDLHVPSAPGVGTRFFLLLGRGGFVPFATDGTPPPAWAFRRAAVDPVENDPMRPSPARSVGQPSHAPGSHPASSQEQ
ncbi:MAG: hypothetical protein WCG85_16455 [Polyangia bacterium]